MRKYKILGDGHFKYFVLKSIDVLLFFNIQIAC